MVPHLHGSFIGIMQGTSLYYVYMYIYHVPVYTIPVCIYIYVFHCMYMYSCISRTICNITYLYTLHTCMHTSNPLNIHNTSCTCSVCTYLYILLYVHMHTSTYILNSLGIQTQVYYYTNCMLHCMTVLNLMYTSLYHV